MLNRPADLYGQARAASSRRLMFFSASSITSAVGGRDLGIGPGRARGPIELA